MQVKHMHERADENEDSNSHVKVLKSKVSPGCMELQAIRQDYLGNFELCAVCKVRLAGQPCEVAICRVTPAGQPYGIAALGQTS